MRGITPCFAILFTWAIWHLTPSWQRLNYWGPFRTSVISMHL